MIVLYSMTPCLFLQLIQKFSFTKLVKDPVNFIELFFFTIILQL